MVTLAELAQTLGGVIRTRDDQQWLDTKVGELRAVVIPRPRSGEVTYVIGVYTLDARELDPTYPPPRDIIFETGSVIPRLRHGYVFIGCRVGVLFATPVAPASLERVVATLWELAEWARAPLRTAVSIDDVTWRADTARRDADLKRQKWRRQLSRLGIVAAIVVAAAVFRRFR